MASLDEQRRHAGLNPLPGAEPAEPAKERGHARGQTHHDDRRIADRALRGVPLVGAGPGCIDGTRPGDSARDLEQAGRDILIANLALAKHKAEEKAEKLREVRRNLKQSTPQLRA